MSDRSFSLRMMAIYSRILDEISRFARIIRNQFVFILLLVSGLFVFLLVQVLTHLLQIEGSLAWTALRSVSFILGIDLFVFVCLWRIKGHLRVEMKNVRQHMLKSVTAEELEILDQTFELAALLLGALFTVLYLLLPQAFHTWSVLVNLLITGMFYITYKVARVKLAIDLRVWIMSIGIGTFITISIFLIIIGPLYLVLLVFYVPDTAFVNGILMSSILTYILGGRLYKERVARIIDRRVEELLSVADEDDKERQKEQVLYLAENGKAPVSVPFAIGVVALSPWISIPIGDLLGTVGVVLLVSLILPTFFAIKNKQYEVFVHPIGPTDGIKDWDMFIPRRKVQDEQLEEVAIRVYDAIFEGDDTIEIEGESYAVSRTHRSRLRSLEIGDLFLVEQNPRKFTKEAEEARQGHQIMWVFRIRDFAALVKDGRFLDLRKTKYLPLFCK